VLLLPLLRMLLVEEVVAVVVVVVVVMVVVVAPVRFGMTSHSAPWTLHTHEGRQGARCHELLHKYEIRHTRLRPPCRATAASPRHHPSDHARTLYRMQSSSLRWQLCHRARESVLVDASTMNKHPRRR
jgi:hypothetical protein